MTQLGIIAKLDELNIQACYAVGPIAQSVEQRTFNPWVDGSSPSGPTLEFRAHLRSGLKKLINLQHAN